MLKIEKFVTPSPEQWEIVIEGMRNPMNSWDRMDSEIKLESPHDVSGGYMELGPNDHELAMGLSEGGGPHAKFRRMLPVHLTINAPLYWWKEFDTYKVGTVCNSCSTMHKIHAKEFVHDDFSCEHLGPRGFEKLTDDINELNYWRDIYLNGGEDDNRDGSARVFEPKDKDAWWQMIQLLPSSFNQKRTICLNYQVLHEMYKWRKNHKLDEWRTFCHWIEELPYSELITLYQEEEE